MADPTFVFGRVSRVADERVRSDEDRVAVEEPLEVRLGRTPVAVTMRTPGHDRELAVGFLSTEGIISGLSDLVETAGPSRKLPNVVSVRLRRGLRFSRSRLVRHFYTNSSCGLCGKTTLQALQVKTRPIASDLRVSPSLLYSLPEKLREEQETFDETGGLHAAAVFDARGHLLILREDVGRHNAVDKVIGAALLQGTFPLERHILMVSGRASFEIMQKALVARVPLVAAVSAPSSLAIALARKFKMTLVGFLRGQNCNLYAGSERVTKGEAG